jgi:hypothetical protein
MSFFKQFPKIKYSINNDGIINNVVDVYRYVDVVEKFSKNILAYSQIDVMDGERPDNLSQRLYGTPDYYWTFFLANDIFKDGLGAWPKAQNELRLKLKADFKNVSVLRFPYYKPSPIFAQIFSVTELPIEKYIDYLYLRNAFTSIVVNGVGYPVYASAPITLYDPELSQIWIDNSKITAESDAFAIDDSQKDRMTTQAQSAFNITQPSTSFHIKFINPETSGTTEYSQVDRLGAQWLKAMAKAILLFRQGTTIGNAAAFGSFREEDYTLFASQSWADGKLAPSYYYDPLNTEERTSQYSSPLEATNYTSIEQYEIDKNDEKRRIKYVLPDYIQSFAKEYRNLLNE